MKAFFIITLITLISSIDSCNDEKKKATGELSIIFTGNVNGKIEPCGWKTNPSGGLARKADYINNLRNEGKSVLIFDSGDLFFQKGFLEDTTRNEMAAKARLILDSFNEMKTTAINIGDDDFMLGTEILFSLRNRAKFPFISTNLYSKEYQKPLFDRYMIRELGEIRFGIIGVAW